MCLIIVKSKGVEKPTSELIRKAYLSNDDLCGISYLKPNGKLLECFRGLTVSELIEINQDMEDSYTVMYHFRIATSGNVNVLNSHPFPLYQNKLKCHTRPKITIAHNGITRGIGNKKYSDTAILVQYLEDNKLDYDFLLTLLASNGGGKFAVMDIDLRGVMLYGDFIEGQTGLQFSNMYWKNEPLHESWGKWNPDTKTWDYGDSTYSSFAEDDKTIVKFDGSVGVCDVCQETTDKLTYDRGIYVCKDCLTWEMNHAKHVKDKIEEED